MAPRIRRRITSTKREELEKQQRELAQTIVRPFEVLSGLPVSFSSPQASDNHALKNPLTVKDSGVFYRSLMKSRYTYVHICPMFTLYWIKQSSYAKKLAEQDKPLPKSAREENTTGRSPLLSGDVSARDVMVKLCDASITLGPHDFEIRLFIAKDERSEKNNKKKDDSKTKDPKLSDQSASNNDMDSTPQYPNKIANISSPQKKLEQLPIDPALNSLEIKGVEKTDNIEEQPVLDKGGAVISKKTSDATTEGETKEKENITKPDLDLNTSDENSGLNTLDKKDDIQGTLVNTLDKDNKEKKENKENKEDKDNTHDSTINTQSTKLDNITPNKDNSLVESAEETGTKIGTNLGPAPGAGPLPGVNGPDSANMQSIENTIMISNLNTIARTDTSLNALMKIVALGKASPQEIIKFQGYIKRAREMGPQPHHAYLFAQNPGYYPYGSNMMKGKKIKEKKPQKEKKLKSKIPKDQKLTAFQEKYLSDATILFEFVENANVRFVFPKNAICEVIEPEKKQNINEEEDIGEVKDILVSFLWIHNQEEIDEYEKKLSEYNKIMEEREQKENPQVENSSVEGEAKTQSVQKESDNNGVAEEEAAGDEHEVKTDSSIVVNNETEEVNNTKNESTDNNQVDQVNKKAVTPRKNTRRRKYTAPKRNSIRKLEMPIEPEKRFMSISFTIHNVPLRFIPIVTNSFNKPEDVQKYMLDVLKNGTRTPNFYLWYQVDGKLDEDLAENIRIQLNQEEKKLTGIPIANLSNSKKRLKKDKEPKQKKSKVENSNSLTELNAPIEPLAITPNAPIVQNQNQTHTIASPPKEQDIKTE